jgi:dsRNA-specific ribonuclease
MRLSSKTPVSILQETCTRICKGSLPYHELTHDRWASLKYPVFADQISVLRSGHSKKEAKHSAAKSILKRLNEQEISPTELDPYKTLHKHMLQENFCKKMEI